VTFVAPSGASIEATALDFCCSSFSLCTVHLLFFFWPFGGRLIVASTRNVECCFLLSLTDSSFLEEESMEDAGREGRRRRSVGRNFGGPGGGGSCPMLIGVEQSSRDGLFRLYFIPSCHYSHSSRRSSSPAR